MRARRVITKTNIHSESYRLTEKPLCRSKVSSALALSVRTHPSLHPVLQGATVVAVSDINADNARAAVALPGVQAEVYADGHDVINASDVDAIRSPPGTRPRRVHRPPSPPVSRYSAKTAGDVCGRLPPHRRCRNEGRPSSGAGWLYAPVRRRLSGAEKVIDDGDIGAPLMLRCAHRNQSVGENYTTDMAITNT